MPRRAAVLALFVSCLIAAAAMAGVEVEGRPRRIVFILLDAARADRFSSYGYARSTTPAIDALAARGALFLNHYAQGTKTRTSLPTLLYSRYVTQQFSPVASMEPAPPDELFQAQDPARISLPRVLRNAGYRTAAISAHVWLDEASVFMREFDERFDLSRRTGGRDSLHPTPASAVVDAALAWIRRSDGATPWFLYLHLMDTHFPHLAGPDAAEFLGDRKAPASFNDYGQPRFPARPLAPPERTWLDGLYDGSLRYADRQLNRLFDRLDQLGPREETLIVVTADHGERLLERPNQMGHGGPSDEPVVRVPLVISGGGVRAARHTRFSEGVDVAPTVVDIARATLPAGSAFDGASLLPSIRRPDLPGPPTAVASCAIRDERFMAMFDDCEASLSAPDRADTGRRERLYDLKADPEETRDLSSEQPRVLLKLRDTYRARVGPSYARHLSNVSTQTPAFPFSVSPSGFDVPDPAEVACGTDAGQRTFVPKWPPTQEEEGATETFERGRPKPIHVTVPDGRYRLSIQVKGKGRVTIDGRMRDVSGPHDAFLGEPGREVDLGDVQVRGKRLCAVIEGGSRESLTVQWLGFVPATLPVPDRDLAEKLRALGYLGKVR